MATFTRSLFFVALLLGLIASPARAGTYSSAVLADNPMAYWRLGESGGTTVLDSSGNGHDGSYLNGVTLGIDGAPADDPDTAADFDGSDDYIAIDDPTPFQFVNQSVTLEAWIQVPDNTEYFEYFWLGAPGGNYLVMGKTRAGWNNGGLYLQTNPGSGGSGVYSASVAGWGGPDLPKNEWMHLVGVVDVVGAELSMYVNGELIVSGALSGFDLSGGGFVTFLGAENSGGYLYGHQRGPMDEMAIYDYALTSEQIGAHYDAAFASGASVSAPASAALFAPLWGLLMYRRGRSSLRARR
ncbi:MAG: LamG domain-containing protein [Gammaproteobacteria bacterium]